MQTKTNLRKPQGMSYELCMLINVEGKYVLNGAFVLTIRISRLQQPL